MTTDPAVLAYARRLADEAPEATDDQLEVIERVLAPAWREHVADLAERRSA